MKRTALSASLLIALLTQPLWSQESLSPAEVGDDFDDNWLDPAKWTAYVGPAALGSVEETQGELQFWVSPDNTSSNYRFDATSNWVLRGDFDIQVDYHLRDWSPASGLRLALKAGGIKRAGYTDSVERLNDRSWGEVYITHFSDGAGGKIPTADATGSLRLVRTDKVITGFYRRDGAWIAIHQGPAAVEDGPVILAVWGHDPTPGALVAFDNFQVNSATLVQVSQPPEPPERSRFFTPTFAPPQILLDFDLADGDQGMRKLPDQAPQQTVWLQLNAVNAPQINGWRLLLKYDPTHLRFVPGSFQASQFIPDQAGLATDATGRLELGATTLATNASNSGSGTLGQLAFEVLDGFAGQTTILATEMVLRFPDGSTQVREVLTAAQVSDGEITAVETTSWGQLKTIFH